MSNNFNKLDCPNGCRQVQKFGVNTDIDSGSIPEDIWTVGGILNDSLIVPPFTVASDNAADSASGTGLRTALFQGVDNTNGNFIETTLTLTGTTPVALPGFSFVNRIKGITSGSNRRNVGTINVTDSAGTPNTVSQIFPNTGQTLQAIFCNPKDWGQLAVLNWYASVGRQAATQANLELTVNPFGFFTSNPTIRTLNTFELNTQGTTFGYLNVNPVCGFLEPLEILRVTVIEVTTNNTRCSAGFGCAKTR